MDTYFPFKGCTDDSYDRKLVNCLVNIAIEISTKYVRFIISQTIFLGLPVTPAWMCCPLSKHHHYSLRWSDPNLQVCFDSCPPLPPHKLCKSRFCWFYLQYIPTCNCHHHYHPNSLPAGFPASSCLPTVNSSHSRQRDLWRIQII